MASSEPQPDAPATARPTRRSLRVMLIATGLLIVPQIGQFLAIHDLNTTGQQSSLTLLFLLVGIFTVPTSLILTGAIFYAARRHRTHEQERILLLGALNLLIVLNLAWFFIHQCSWSHVFDIALQACR